MGILQLIFAREVQIRVQILIHSRQTCSSTPGRFPIASHKHVSITKKTPKSKQHKKMWSSRQSQSLVNVSEKSCLHPARLRASSNLKKKYGRPDFLVVFFQVFCKKNTLCLLIYDIMVSFIIKWTSLKGAQLVQHRADSGLCGLYKQV